MSTDDATTTAAAASDDDVTSSTTPSYVDDGPDETTFEKYSDIVLGLAFLVTALISIQRMYANRKLSAGGSTTGSSGGNRQQSQQGGGGSGAETTVVTAFYSLILATSVLRAIWFLIPKTVWQPSYTPAAVYAWDSKHPSWSGYALSEITVTAGSLTLFSIFILILVYWADILKKYYNPGSRRSLPMATFLGLVLTLLVLELINLLMFLTGLYTTEGMILFNACLLATVSIVCVCEITIFSQKFQNVLKTLGAINQVSTDSQIRRIVWITVTGNLFFFSRALLETVFAVTLIIYWWHHKTVDRAFTHVWWDTYTLLKYWSELTILALMLHILQSRFSANSSSSANTNSTASGTQPSQSNSAGYTKVPDASVNV